MFGKCPKLHNYMFGKCPKLHNYMFGKYKILTVVKKAMYDKRIID